MPIGNNKTFTQMTLKNVEDLKKYLVGENGDAGQMELKHLKNKHAWGPLLGQFNAAWNDADWFKYFENGEEGKTLEKKKLIINFLNGKETWDPDDGDDGAGARAGVDYSPTPRMSNYGDNQELVLEQYNSAHQSQQPPQSPTGLSTNDLDLVDKALRQWWGYVADFVLDSSTDTTDALHLIAKDYKLSPNVHDAFKKAALCAYFKLQCSKHNDEARLINKVLAECVDEQILPYVMKGRLDITKFKTIIEKSLLFVAELKAAEKPMEYTDGTLKFPHGDINKKNIIEILEGWNIFFKTFYVVFPTGVDGILPVDYNETLSIREVKAMLDQTETLCNE